MARRLIDLDQKVEEIRTILNRYGGIPTQQQDRAAYANINYYLKKYGDAPQIQNLIADYNLSVKKRPTSEVQINDIAIALQELGRIPAVKDNQTLYAQVRYVFNKYADDPSVIRLKYLYAHSSCYPLPNSKYGPKPKDDFHYDSWSDNKFVSDEWIKWKNGVTYEYLEYVYKCYQELPGAETKPMEILKNKIDHWYRYNVDVNKSERAELFDFLQRMIDDGCDDTMIKQAYYSFKFISSEVQERVEKMIIENGACAIHYIAQTVIPECPLADKFVYSYYYVRLNDQKDNREKMPLGSLYSSVEPQRVLRIHYRDYHKCDIDKIRESARIHYRNWLEYRPETLDEWKYYGQSEFFADKEDFFSARILGAYDSSIDWSTTYIEKQLIKGKPYFRHYRCSKRYLDYYLYLLENGYTLTDNDLLEYLGTEYLADDVDMLPEDWLTYIKILHYLPHCFKDSDGGYYLKENDKCTLLCLTKNITTYKLNENTTKISRNAFKLVEDCLEQLTINHKLSKKYVNLDNFSKLEKIIIPDCCVDEYIKVFTKKEATLFYGLRGNKIKIDAKIVSDTLQYVPQTEIFIVPDNVVAIEQGALKNSRIKRLTISGGIKKIDENLLYSETALEEVIIKEGVEEMWGYTFGDCKNLKKVTLPNSLTVLYKTFKGCSSLETIKLDNVSYIGDETFCGCSSLEKICVEGHLRNLGRDAFMNCTNLKYVEFKNGIDEIHGAFSNCINLETIVLRGQYKSFGYYSKNMGIYGCDKLKAIYVPAEYMSLFKENFSPEYHHLLQEL